MTRTSPRLPEAAVTVTGSLPVSESDLAKETPRQLEPGPCAWCVSACHRQSLAQSRCSGLDSEVAVGSAPNVSLCGHAAMCPLLAARPVISRLVGL